MELVRILIILLSRWNLQWAIRNENKNEKMFFFRQATNSKSMMGLGHMTSFLELEVYPSQRCQTDEVQEGVVLAKWEGSDMSVRVEFQGFSRCWETSIRLEELVFSDSLKHAFICLTVMRVEGNKFSDKKDDMWLAPLGFDIYDLDHGKCICIYLHTCIIYYSYAP